MDEVVVGDGDGPGVFSSVFEGFGVDEVVGRATLSAGLSRFR
ncbi:hypothetical protein ACFQES_26950 [Nonomuraea salmonea]